MRMGNKYMTVVIIESGDMSNIPSDVRKHLFAKETGTSVPKGYLADMGGEDLIRYYSYDQLKKKEWYKQFVDISKAEKKKPDYGSFAHYISKEAKVKNLSKEVMSFKYGSSVKSPLGQLQYKVKKGGEIGKEAETVIKVVNDWGDQQKSEIDSLLTKEPTKAYMKMEVLAKTFLGMPLVEDYPKQIASMKKDKYFAYLLGLRRQYDRVMSAEKKNASTAKYLATKLEAFAGKVKDETLKGEAQKMASELSSI